MIAPSGNRNESGILSVLSETWPNTTVGLIQNNVCCVFHLLREPLGASSDTAGSESLPALLQHCITKAKGVAANNNNNTTSGRRTGLSDDRRAATKDYRSNGRPVYESFASLSGASFSQTQQQSQTPQEGEDLNLPRKRKKQNKKNPYLYLTSFLRRRQFEEDQTGILASADSEGPNYGTLRWPVCPTSHWTRLNWPPLRNPTSARPALPKYQTNTFLIILKKLICVSGSGKHWAEYSGVGRQEQWLFRVVTATCLWGISLENALKIYNVYK